jgi:hypothetical protein
MRLTPGVAADYADALGARLFLVTAGEVALEFRMPDSARPLG